MTGQFDCRGMRGLGYWQVEVCSSPIALESANVREIVGDYLDKAASSPSLFASAFVFQWSGFKNTEGIPSRGLRVVFFDTSTLFLNFLPPWLLSVLSIAESTKRKIERSS